MSRDGMVVVAAVAVFNFVVFQTAFKVIKFTSEVQKHLRGKKGTGKQKLDKAGNLLCST